MKVESIASEIRRLLRREEHLRAELRAVSEKLAAVRAALGMGHTETPDYADSESRDPYVTTMDLAEGAVRSANRPVAAADIVAALAAVRPLTNQQAAWILIRLYERRRIQRVSRGRYAALPTATSGEPAEDDAGVK